MKKQLLFVVSIVLTTTFYAQNIPSYVPSNGLVGWWPFNGNANDESGNGNNGTVNGASLTTDRNGISNNAYYFNHFDEITTNFSIISGNQTRTFSFWMKNQNSTRTITPIWYGGNSSQPIQGAAFNILFNRNEQHDQCNCYPNTYEGIGVGADWIYTLKNTLVGDNKWHNWVIVQENVGDKFQNLKFYKDGVLINTSFVYDYNNNSSTAINTINQVKLKFGRSMADQNVSSSLLDKAPTEYLDDIAIYNRALTQQEITALYSGGNQSALASTKVYVDAPATVNQNDTVQLSISTETLNTTDNVISYQTDFSYDTTRYIYVSNNLVGTLNPSGNVVVNSSKNGKLSISYMTQTALIGAGSLVKLKFKANKVTGNGVFGLSNFLYNTTAITSLKSDTVNTIDVTPPTAKITYSQNPVRKGDSLLITVNFNEKMAVSPVPQLNLTGQNTLANTNLTKVNDTTYTYWWVVEKGNGAVNVNLATGKDLGGNVIVATPTQNPSFTVLPTLFGDIDTNKLVQAYDAALALQYSVGLNPLPTMDPLPWSNWRLAVANVDTVGNVTANDASLILQYSAKLISTFPADAKKRGGDAPTANVTVTQEGNQLVFRATGTLYAFNVYLKDNFNVFGQPEVKDKNAMVASNLNTTTYNVGLASTTPFIENEPFLVIPILTNDNIQGTMDIVANTQEKSLSFGKAAGISSINKEVVLVYPNPTKDVVTINNAQGKTLRIVDVQGKEVYNQKVNASTMEVSMKAIATRGTYVLHILDVNNETIQTKQVVLE
jgi:hypothetical protein